MKIPQPLTTHIMHVAAQLAKVAAGQDTNTLLTYDQHGTLQQMCVRLGYGVALTTNSSGTVKVEVLVADTGMSAGVALHLSDEIKFASDVARAINTDKPLPAYPA